MAKTGHPQKTRLSVREIGAQLSPRNHSENQSMIWQDCAEVKDSETRHDLLRDLAWFKKKALKIVLWKRIEPYLPELLPVTTTNPTIDYIVGMTLHCFILSVFVLSVAAARATMSLLKFACHVTLHYAIYKGDLTPILEDSTEPVTVDQLREATIFNSSGLKIVLVHNRSPINTNRIPTTTPRPRDSGSDSSQALSNIFSFSSA